MFINHLFHFLLMGFSDFDKKILEVFVTSATDPVYAIKSNVPPEVFGAFGSFFSRNPKDIRYHLLDAIHGNIRGFEEEVQQSDLEWLIKGDFREPFEAISSGVAKSQDFYKTWYGKFSHRSVANVVWIPIVGNNITQLVARELAYDQLAFFIEQSSRFVKMDVENLFKDPDVMESRHKDLYMETLTFLADSYLEMTKEIIGHYKQEIPFEDWLKLQNDEFKESKLKEQKAAYNRELRGKGLDVSRFFLPQATPTNIAWIVDARSTEFDIAAWKGHPLSEIREVANLMEKAAGQIAPSLLKYTERNSYYTDKLNNYGGDLVAEHSQPFEKGVDIISYENDALNKVVGHLLTRHNRGGTFRQRYEQAQGMNFNEKIDFLRRVTKNRGPHDEWIEMDEDFDLVNITFGIRTDVGAKRDLIRHQKWDRGEPIYTLDNGYHKPYMLKDMAPNIGKLFDNAMEVAHSAEKRIRKEFPFQAQYLIPMAANHELTMSAGLDQLQYMIYQRSTPQGNFSYRQDMFNLAEAVLKVHPWMWGYKEYPEGLDLKQAYEKAPLKNLLKLQFGDMALHK